MASGKELTNSQKEQIVKLWKEGKSYKKMSDNQNIPFPTISSFIARYKKKAIENQRRTGAPQKICSRSLRKLMHKIKQNPMVTHQELHYDLFSLGIYDTKRWISNEIHRNNLESPSPQKTPLIVKRHRCQVEICS